MVAEHAPEVVHEATVHALLAERHKVIRLRQWAAQYGHRRDCGLTEEGYRSRPCDCGYDELMEATR